MIIEMRMPPQGGGIRISVVGMGSGQRLGEKERSIVRLIAIMAPNVIMMLTVAPPEHILYGSDYPYMSDGVLFGNLQRMREQFAADKELSPYLEQFFSENARNLFNK